MGGYLYAPEIPKLNWIVRYHHASSLLNNLVARLVKNSCFGDSCPKGGLEIDEIMTRKHSVYSEDQKVSPDLLASLWPNSDNFALTLESVHVLAVCEHSYDAIVTIAATEKWSLTFLSSPGSMQNWQQFGSQTQKRQST